MYWYACRSYDTAVVYHATYHTPWDISFGDGSLRNRGGTHARTTHPAGMVALHSWMVHTQPPPVV